MARVAELIRRYERRRQFWRHVHVGGPDECWTWDGEVDADGHPRFHGRSAARHACELARGRPPASLEPRCGNRRCVNPEHLL